MNTKEMREWYKHYIKSIDQSDTAIYSPTFENEIIQNRRVEVLHFLKEIFPEDFI